ncbi:hypothetical protein WR25_10651 [Diploscapter pachys]|uniref:SH3 domain-containing protein n=1 Tax=Diploscapter pachys TaxID=2018661 RepID=A0A2A2M0S3_9BILA|nr:hypothetical protein WR25_10651 [Diploscapter pachys]
MKIVGLPDPPTGVQVELGPQPGTLLVSWQSVTNQPKPPSRAAVHSYLIYADGKNIAQVPNATADHALLRLADLSDDPPIFITVRTRTREGSVSADSNVARVPRGSYQSQSGSTSTAAALIDPATGQILHQQQQSLPLFDMTSSYPSYANHATYSQLPNAFNAQTGPLSGPLPSAPYTAPPALIGATGAPLLSATFQQPAPITAYTANVLQPQSTTVAPYGQFDRTAAAAAAAAAQNQAAVLSAQAAALQQQQQHLLLQQASLPGVNQSTLQGTLSKWKTPSMLSQYYTFHPRLLRAEPSGVEDTRPSVLEMENNYLLRHRQAEWASQSDAQARIDRYAMATHRAGSADGRLPNRHRLVPPRLARVKSESGFGTRSEPDLRPPTLDDDCRWFVALFDYDHHMSPNANAENEELSFRKHQLIKVYGEVDPDGFYHGQIGNRHGLVPSNMVIEIAKDDLLPSRAPTTVASAAEPALRRMRWGSLKSRSYDHAGDRRAHDRPVHSYYASLDRRDGPAPRSDRSDPRLDRYRYRQNGGGKELDYNYRRDYDDRYGGPRPRDDYGPRERDYRDEEEYRELKYARERGYDRDRDYYDEPRRKHDSGHGASSAQGPSTSGTGPYDRDYRGNQPPRRGDIIPGREIRHPLDDGYDMGYGAGSVSGSSRYDHQQPGPSGMGPGPQPTNQMVSQMNHQMGGMQIGGPSQQSMQMGQMGQQQLNTPMMGQQGQMIGQQSMMQPGGMQTIQGMPGPTTSQQVNMIPSLLNESSLNGMQQRKMVAKFDYDSRQLSPNVDAEQVELSFRQGEIITVFGEMDEDGFYMGELNGQRGLVPSNFLQSSPLTSLAPSQPTEPLRKGVAFSDNQMMTPAGGVKRAPPTSQTQSSGSMSVAAAATAMSAVAKVASGPKKSLAGQQAGAGASKPLAKKASDVGKNATPNARKTSTAVKKSDSNVKV